VVQSAQNWHRQYATEGLDDARRRRVEGAGESAMAHVNFRDQGIKRLLLRYAPVEKL